MKPVKKSLDMGLLQENLEQATRNFKTAKTNFQRASESYVKSEEAYEVAKKSIVAAFGQLSASTKIS
jgi:hypothetical protein